MSYTILHPIRLRADRAASKGARDPSSPMPATVAGSCAGCTQTGAYVTACTSEIAQSAKAKGVVEVKAISDEIVEVAEVSVPSKVGNVNIMGTVWTPAAGSAAAGMCPRGIVHLVHGMTEYVDRYDVFARFLVEQGYLVVGHDHLGHGRSVNDPSERSDLPAKEGMDALIEDTHSIRLLAQKRFGEQLPYVLVGHSMGSFVVRAYIARHAEGLAGAIVCGTADQPLWKSKAGNALARFLAATRGNSHRSKLMNKLADGGYAKSIPDARTPYDWLSYDSAHIEKYAYDDECGNMFSVGGYATLTALTADNAKSEMVALIPDNLPILLIAGAEDPVGENGAAVQRVAERFEAAGKNVQLKLYKGRRHELLNDADNDQITKDLLAWIDKVCASEREVHSI